MQTMKRVSSFAIGALVLASCSGGESSAPTTAALDVTTSVADTTPSTTTPPSTVAVTTTAATTTIPATTTTVATEDLIKQAVQAYFEAYEQCGIAPADCAPDTFTAVQGPSRGILTDFVQGLVANGLYFSTERRGQYLVAESVDVTSSAEATATYCVYDAGIVLGPNGPDGVPTVVNDGIASVRYSYGLFLEDGVWSVGREHELDRLGEGNLCPPSD